MKYIAVIFVFLGIVGCDKPDAADSAATTGATVGATGGAPELPATAEPTTVSLPNQNEPYHGLVTAGQPTTEQFAKLKPAGYSAVINLRPDSEPGYWDEQEEATRAVLLYTHIPIAGSDDLTRAKVEKFAATLEQPMAKKGKVLVHCASGNRAGAMVALKAHWIDGRSIDDSLDIGRKAGLKGLEQDVMTIMESAAKETAE